MAYHFESREDLERFIKREIYTSSEAMEFLGISRQALNSLVQRGKLVPIKEEKATKVFFKEDLLKRMESLPERPVKPLTSDMGI